MIVFYILKCSFTVMQHSSGRGNICDENPDAFLKINNTTVLHSVFCIKTKPDCVLLRGVTSDEFFLEMLLILPVKRSIHVEQQS